MAEVSLQRFSNQGITGVYGEALRVAGEGLTAGLDIAGGVGGRVLGAKKIYTLGSGV